jgi:hypothetical protein
VNVDERGKATTAEITMHIGHASHLPCIRSTFLDSVTSYQPSGETQLSLVFFWPIPHLLCSVSFADDLGLAFRQKSSKASPTTRLWHRCSTSLWYFLEIEQDAVVREKGEAKA